jgi:transposase
MINFQFDPWDLEYSAKVSSKRLEKAALLIGDKMVKRIIAIALFFLGAKRKQISEMLNIPLGTFFTFLSRFHNCGTDAFSMKAAVDKIEQPAHRAQVIYEHAGTRTCLIFSEEPLKLSLKKNNPLQHKVLVLSFFNWGIISCTEAAKHLGFTESHIRDLSQTLEACDVDGLIDKRKGQQQDYSFTAEVKAELIQQFSFNVITGKTVSSQQLCQQVNEACSTHITDRSIRLHMKKLGLSTIRRSLFKMVDDFKKNSPN